MASMSKIAAIINGLRAQPFGLSQAEISRRTGIPQPRISRWGSGDVAAGADDALKLMALASEVGFQVDIKTPLERAIARAGGLTEMAKKLGVTGHAVIYQWKKTRVPADRCPDIEALTGVRCEELRPDVNWSVLRAAPAASSTTEA